MSLRIRLARVGRKHQPSYRIVVAEARSKRGGRSVETIGFYDPKTDPPLVKIDQEKYQKWQKCGAQPSEGLNKILLAKSKKGK